MTIPPSPPSIGDPPLAPDVYRRMASVLRIGLGLALVVLVGGLVAFYATHPGSTSAQLISANPALGFLGLPGFVAGLAAGNPAAILTLGLLLLVATPVARVAAGFYFFRRNHERGLTAITLTVLCFLLVGLFLFGPLLR